MKILMIHKFHYIEGGAERYVFNLTDLLNLKGHEIVPFSMHHPDNANHPYQHYFSSYFNPSQFAGTPAEIFKNSWRAIYNKEAREKLSDLIQDVQPDIAHVHSIYHHLSPAILSVLKKNRLPVVMTLHDYKVICPNYILLDGNNCICESCQGKYYWHAVQKKCFRNSYPASFLVASEAYIHNFLKSYKNNIDIFVSPSQFLADKIRQYGFGHKPVNVQPYTLDLSNYKPNYANSDYIVFMGRLTEEKGVDFLLNAMKLVKSIKLKIAGTGPLENHLKARIGEEKIDNVEMVGYHSGEDLKRLVSHALFTVVTSEWHDNSPLVIYESFALGNPVIASPMGGIPELIREGRTGFIYKLGNPEDFAEKIEMLAQNPELAMQMGKNARQFAEENFAPEAHYRNIMTIYQQALAQVST